MVVAVVLGLLYVLVLVLALGVGWRAEEPECAPTHRRRLELIQHGARVRTHRCRRRGQHRRHRRRRRGWDGQASVGILRRRAGRRGRSRRRRGRVGLFFVTIDAVALLLEACLQPREVLDYGRRVFERGAPRVGLEPE